MRARTCSHIIVMVFNDLATETPPVCIQFRKIIWLANNREGFEKATWLTTTRLL